jgi:hypothetical protein
MVKERTIEEQIINIISSVYKVEILHDECLGTEDERNLCLDIKDSDVKADDIKKLIKDLDIRVVKYGSIAVFSPK